jgi:sigma-B regulation protein RsbU (phosphoserine phosphatase)
MILIAGFSIIIGLLMVVLFTGVNRMGNIARQVDAIVHVHDAKVQHVVEMYNVARERWTITLTMFLLQDPFQRDEAYQRFHAMALRFLDARQNYRDLGMTPEEEENLDRVSKYIGLAYASQIQIGDALIEGRDDDARRVMLGKSLQQQEDALQAMHKLVADQKEASRQAADASSHAHQEAYLVMLLGGWILVVVAIITALLAIYSHDRVEQLLRRAREDNLRMGMELDVARRLQHMVLPKPADLSEIQSLDIAGYMESATEVGGDYYDVLKDNGRVKICIGDVTGHGLESGVVMLMVQTAMQALLHGNITDPKIMINVLNRTIFHNTRRMGSDKNLTLSMLDYQDGEITLSGQHEEMLLARKDKTIERIDTFDLGFFVGLEADISRYIAERRFHLQAGDGVVLYTDGIVEARSPHSEMFGVERLCQVVKEHWHLPAREIQHAVIRNVRFFMAGGKLRDDMTLLVIKQR